MGVQDICLHITDYNIFKVHTAWVKSLNTSSFYVDFEQFTKLYYNYYFNKYNKLPFQIKFLDVFHIVIELFSVLYIAILTTWKSEIDRKISNQDL